MERNGAYSLSAYTTPEVVEIDHQEYVEYGDDNNYFGWLIDRYLGSTTNNAIITGMVRNIFGEGLSATDKDEQPIAWSQVEQIISKNCLKKFITDRKMLGMAALQVTKSGGRITKITHWPMETLRAEKANEKGQVKAYYYHPKWQDKKPADTPKRIPTYEFSPATGNCIYVFKPYTPGSYYYSPVDYQGALPYAVLEEEIADYLINDTINGFSGTKVVNFNNGVPDAEKREQIKNKTLDNLTGTKGQKVLISFNKNTESATTVEDITLNDAPAHYEYLAGECFTKLIIGHRVTSPMLLGVRDGNNGLGNNADEIRNATLLLEGYVIDSYREEIIACLNELLSYNGIELDLFFKPLTPLEFVDVEAAEEVGGEEAVAEATGIDVEEQEQTNMFKQFLSWVKGNKKEDNLETEEDND